MRVYHLHNEELTDKERNFIEESFEKDALIVYIPKIADVAKGSLKTDFFNEHITESLALWGKLFAEYPGEYMDSFLIGNCGFWYPFMPLTLTANGAEGYFVCRATLPVWDDSKIPAIYQHYRHFEVADIVCNNPLTMWLFSPATYFYAFLLTLMKLIYEKRKETVAFIPVLFVWLTFLLGPVALVRYVYFLYGLLPVEVALLHRKR